MKTNLIYNFELDKTYYEISLDRINSHKGCINGSTS